jgi:hypothetical protein
MSKYMEALRPETQLAGARPEPDYVPFWRMGAQVTGTFCCAACGRAVRSVRQLPDCPTCGGTIWEDAASSPFGSEAAQRELVEDPWFHEEVRSVAGLTRGVALTLVLVPLSWLVPFAAVYAIAHG